MKDIHEQTYYELLDVESTATQEEILKAYNRARNTYGNNSPALYSLFNKEEAQELLRLIDEAYNVLSNQFKRKQYDQNAAAFHSKTPATVEQTQQDSHQDHSSDLAAMMAATTAGGVLDDIVNPEPKVEPYRPPEITDKPAASKPPGPSGYGTTQFSRYKVDPAFEDEIKKMEIFSGNTIQKIRMYKNIALDQISETTKVSRPYLNAIETDNYTSLPAPVFLRGFLIQISKILGLDPNKVASSYLKMMKETQKK